MRIKTKLIDFVSRCGLPILLASVIAHQIEECYFYEQRWLLTFLFAAASVLFFVLFDYLKKHRIVGSLIYLGLLVASGYFGSAMMSRGWYSSHVVFTDWFYLNRDAAGFNIYYFLAVYITGGFFLISIIYYFTQLRPAALGLMLCLLFPFVIYAKRADIMTSFSVTLIITVFLAIIVHNRQQKTGDTVKGTLDLPYIITVSVFVSFVGALAMFIPKPEIRSVLERDSHAFDITPLNSSSNSSYSNYSKLSSARYGASYTNQILFYAEASHDQDVYYLKRQAYDSFYDEIWHNDRGAEKYTTYDYYSRVNIDRKTYYETLKALADTGKYTGYGLDSRAFKVPEMEKAEFRVYDETFKGAYVPAPSGVIAKTFSESLNDPYYLYGDGEIAVKNLDRDYDYTVSYYPETTEYTLYALDLGMTGENYYAMLNAAYENGDLASDALLEQYRLAYENYTGQIEFTERMETLTKQIIQGKTSDYAKARALCDYFENNGYVYDMEYVPEDTSIDYFIFEGKTGVCSSYATAMAIMARIAGLPARYVEGFAAYERSDDGTLVIRDAHAHAYVEVFIPGAGWCDFDPTVTGYTVDYSDNGGFSFASIKEFFSRGLIFIVVLLFVFVIVMLDRILELVFRIRQRFVKGDERIIRLYARVRHLLTYSGGDDLSAHTARMLESYAMTYNGADIVPVSTLFERTCFGGIPLTDEAYEKAYAHYKYIYKFLRKRPKPKKIKQEEAPA